MEVEEKVSYFFFFENVTSFYSYALLHTICYAPHGHSYVEREDIKTFQSNKQCRYIYMLIKLKHLKLTQEKVK